jgi:hypothetical protein
VVVVSDDVDNNGGHQGGLTHSEIKHKEENSVNSRESEIPLPFFVVPKKWKWQRCKDVLIHFLLDCLIRPFIHVSNEGMDHDNQLEKRNGLKYENARKRFGRQGVNVYIWPNVHMLQDRTRKKTWGAAIKWQEYFD